MTEQERRVNQAVIEVSNLILSYGRFPTQNEISIRIVTAILKDLELNDFSLLYFRLAELAGLELGSIYFDEAAEFINAARMDHEFGQLTAGMADWYDNEVRACRSGRNKRVIDQIIQLVETVEKEKLRK